MATLVRKRRLVNAGATRRRRYHRKHNRHLSPRQIKFFGTKAQKAALKASRKRKRHNASRRSTYRSFRRKPIKMGVRRHRRIKRALASSPIGAPRTNVSRRKSKKAFRKSRATHLSMTYGLGMKAARKKARKIKYKRHNVGSIITVYPMHNLGRRKNVAVRHRKRRHNVVHHRRPRRHNVAYRGVLSKYRGRRSPGRYVYSSNAGRRRRHHNAIRRGGMGGMFGGTANKVLSIIGGATVTKLISDLLPVSFQGGILGYVGIGLVAVAQGQIAGRMIFRSPTVGENMTAGGLVYLTIKILNDLVPSLGGTLGLRGMGLIAPTQGFAVPLVNQMGSMGTFVRPGFVPAPYVPPVHAGLGSTQSIRRGGRIR